jgi:transposase
MARPLVSDALWAEIEPLLPPPKPRPKGGRPPIPSRAALSGILFVLKSGIPWEMLPKEMGGGSGMTCWRQLRDWQQAGVWAELHRVLLDRLGRANAIDWGRCSLDSASVPAKGGRRDRPEPDRPGQAGQQAARPGRRAGGIPLAVALTPANVHDSTMLEPVLDAVPPIRQCAGRPRRRPAKLHTDKAFDFPRCRRACRRRGIVARIARRGVDSSERLGRHRWVAERTLAWFARFRRLTVRYERRADIFEAFHRLAAALICFRFTERWFC